MGPTCPVSSTLHSLPDSLNCDGANPRGSRRLVRPPKMKTDVSTETFLLSLSSFEIDSEMLGFLFWSGLDVLSFCKSGYALILNGLKNKTIFVKFLNPFHYALILIIYVTNDFFHMLKKR